MTRIKSLARKIIPKKLARELRRLRLLLGYEAYAPVPFDNTYEWLNYAFLAIMKNTENSAARPAYTWGVIQGAALAKVLGMKRISVIEFGVAGGCGLIALERIAKAVEKRTNLAIDVFGFDTGAGLPQPQDFRDQPNLWFAGQLPMNRGKLEAALDRARLYLGPVRETAPSFLADNPAPIAFVSFDMDLYLSTRDAMTIFQSGYSSLLPRVVLYVDNTFGHTYNDYCGERLAISEFNACNNRRRICPIYGLRYFIPRVAFTELWPDNMHFVHLFEHPLYNNLDSFAKPVSMEIDGGVAWGPPQTLEDEIGRSAK
jgi:hypothetical protein